MRLLVLLSFVFPLFGCFVGNPGSPSIMNQGFFSSTYPIFKATTGYLGDYTSDKRYVSTRSSTPDELRHFGIHSQMATVSVIFLERLEILGAAGGSKEHAKWAQNATMSDITTTLLDFESTYQFSWGIGAKVILLQWGQTFLTTDYNYFCVPTSQKSYFRFLNRLNLNLMTEKQTFSIREWQVSAGLASRFFFVTPYGGITYLNSKLDIHSGVGIPPLYYRNKEHFGYYYGLTLSLTGRMHITMERRVRDEFSYSIAATLVF